MNKWLWLALPVVAWACTGEKDKETGSGSFPVLAFIQSQVAHVDTSLYNIIKVETADGRSDTAYLQREDFRTAAAPFLSLPDIAGKDLRNAYVESKTWDELLQRVVLDYSTTDDRLEVRREQVLIQPGNGGPDEVKTILITQVQSRGDSTVQKNLLWEANSHFQVATSTQKGAGPERRTLIKVIWK